MMNSLKLDPGWRDWWGIYDAPAVAQVEPIDPSRCYRPRLMMIPSVDAQAIPASGKIDYTFFVKPGSIIWGLLPDTQGTVFQLTDIGLGHQFGQDATDGEFIAEGAPPASGTFQGPTFLPGPHPVTGDGLFRVEIWGTVGVRVAMYLLIAEASECDDQRI